MKKFIAYLLCIISSVCLFMLAACSSPDGKPKEPSTNDDIKKLAEFELYADVGEKYDTVMQPIKTVAEYIVADLSAHDAVKMPSDAEMTGIRYCNFGSGATVYIYFRQNPKIYDTETNTGYWSEIDDLYVPQNEEYAEFFEKIKIEETDFNFYFAKTEGTELYF